MLDGALLQVSPTAQLPQLRHTICTTAAPSTMNTQTSSAHHSQLPRASSCAGRWPSPLFSWEPTALLGQGGEAKEFNGAAWVRVSGVLIPTAGLLLDRPALTSIMVRAYAHASLLPIPRAASPHTTAGHSLDVLVGHSGVCSHCSCCS